jgi:Flp pilus assembly protein TadG
MHSTTQRGKAQPGQALVEMAVVLPILLLLFLGLIAFGQLLLANYTVNQAARAGAHQAALSGGDADVARLAASQVIAGGVGMRPSSATVTVHCAKQPCRRYDAITVAVRYQGHFWAPFPGFNVFQVSASATRAAERDRQ